MSFMKELLKPFDQECWFQIGSGEIKVAVKFLLSEATFTFQFMRTILDRAKAFFNWIEIIASIRNCNGHQDSEKG